MGCQIYIPIWFYSNIYPLTVFRAHSNLHSNMVLLKFYPDRCITPVNFIYIPIWFYSNLNSVNLMFLYFSFTFQYGSTQMSTQTDALHPSILFTFQYGSTQILHLLNLSEWDMHLHSNMVLLKL